MKQSWTPSRGWGMAPGTRLAAKGWAAPQPGAQPSVASGACTEEPWPHTAESKPPPRPWGEGKITMGTYRNETRVTWPASSLLGGCVNLSLVPGAPGSSVHELLNIPLAQPSALWRLQESAYKCPANYLPPCGWLLASRPRAAGPRPSLSKTAKNGCCEAKSAEPEPRPGCPRRSCQRSAGTAPLGQGRVQFGRTVTAPQEARSPTDKVCRSRLPWLFWPAFPGRSM